MNKREMLRLDRERGEFGDAVSSEKSLRSPTGDVAEQRHRSVIVAVVIW